MPVFEGKWDCSQCRTVGIPGLVTRCPNCGDPRNIHLDPEESPYLPDDARTLTSTEDIDRANAGPDWNCGKCGTNNRGDQESCASCGDPKNHNDRVAPVHTYVDGVDAQGVDVSEAGNIEKDWVDSTLQSSDPLQELEDGPVSTRSRTFSMRDLPRASVLGVRDRARRTSKMASTKVGFNITSVIVAFAALLVALSGYFVYANFIKAQDVDLTVSSLTWERGVEVEQFRTLSKSDWTYPSDARVTGSRQEIHHYDRVLDRYDTKTRQVPETKQTGTRSETYVCGSTTVNNGNGTFSSRSTYCTRQVPVYTTTYRTETYREPVYKSVPVYKTKYDFQIDRWVTDYFDRDSGEVDPFWPKPDVPATCPVQPRVGDKCVGDARQESYEVVLSDKEGRTFNREVGLGTWTVLSKGDLIAAKQTRRGTVRGIEWPVD